MENCVICQAQVNSNQAAIECDDCKLWCHQTQAVWRHVQELGLATAYKNNKVVHSFIRSELFISQFKLYICSQNC